MSEIYVIPCGVLGSKYVTKFYLRSNSMLQYLKRNSILNKPSKNVPGHKQLLGKHLNLYINITYSLDNKLQN